MATSDWSDVPAVDWLNTSQSFYHPIIGCPDVTGSIWILCTIGLCEHIQYIQSTCIHYAVFKHSRYDYVVYKGNNKITELSYKGKVKTHNYCYTVHLEISSSHIDIYIYSKATLHLSRLVTGSIDRGCINLFFSFFFLFFLFFFNNNYNKQHIQVSIVYFTHCQLSVLVLFLQIKVWSFSVLSIRKDSGSLLSS